MIGKPSCPVRREAARKRINPRLTPRCAADPSRAAALVPPPADPLGDPRRHPQSLPQPGLRHHLLAPTPQPLIELGVLSLCADVHRRPSYPCAHNSPQQVSGDVRIDLRSVSSARPSVRSARIRMRACCRGPDRRVHAHRSPLRTRSKSARTGSKTSSATSRDSPRTKSRGATTPDNAAFSCTCRTSSAGAAAGSRRLVKQDRSSGDLCCHDCAISRPSHRHRVRSCQTTSGSIRSRSVSTASRAAS
ncbi:hypothetical protein LX90_009290 [Lentzea flava]|nr:hypothetical protein [Lentzea flava]